MSLHPREPLTAEERALAAQMQRLRGSVEPDSSLDARVLAAARSAVAAAPARRPRMRWIAPMAVAASLSLAVGLAWRLQPPLAGVAQPSHAEAVAIDLPQARAIQAPADAGPLNEPVISPPAAQPEPPRTETQRAVVETVAMPPSSTPVPAAPAPPAPLPASSSDVSTRTANPGLAATPATAPLSSQGMAKAASSGDAARESAPASAAAAPRSQANEAAIAASATADDPMPFPADDPGEEVPPATADSPEVRDAWLRRIGELLQQGRIEDARASLAEFRRRYPDAPLPPDLRALGP